MKKPKSQANNKSVGSSSSFTTSVSTTQKKSPLMPRKDYSKGKKQEDQLREISFGQTGLTGES